MPHPVIPAHTALLREAGHALYGPNWVEPLAHALDYNLRTVQRWAAGTNSIPPWTWGEIVRLFGLRADEMTEGLERIRRHIQDNPTSESERPPR